MKHTEELDYNCEYVLFKTYFPDTNDFKYWVGSFCNECNAYLIEYGFYDDETEARNILKYRIQLY